VASTPAYSKTQLRRAGRLLRDLSSDKRAIVSVSEDELLGEAAEFLEAAAIVDWWRAQHARPLARTNAGLRYYLRKLDVDPMSRSG